MSVIIRLQNLPLTANSIDIRNFFRGLSIPDGGVHIVGGAEGDAFIAFSTDEDARQGMQLSGSCLKDSPVKLLLSSRNEMYKVIEQARQQALGILPSSGNSPTDNVSMSSPQTQNQSGGGVGISSPSNLPLSQLSSVSNPVVGNLGLGFPGVSSTTATTTTPSGGVPFPAGLGNSLTSGALSQGSFAALMTGQADVSSFAGIFSQHSAASNAGVGPSAAGLTGSRALNSTMTSVSQNPFLLSQAGAGGVGNNLPMGFPGGVPNGTLQAAGGLMGSGVAGTSANPSLVGLPSAALSSMTGTGPGQFGGMAATVSRMPLVSSITSQAAGLMNPYGMSQGSQAYGGMNPNIMSAGALGAGHMGVNQGRPPFSATQQQHQHQHQQNSSNAMSGMGRGDRRPGIPGAFNNTAGLGGPGPRDRDGPGFSPRGDRDTRVERERGGRRSQSRSRERKDGRDRSRRRSRSRERERSRERRRGGRRSSKSRSRSRDRERPRSRRASSRDKRRRSDSSPDKGLKTGSPADRKDTMENLIVTITDEAHPCAKLSGLTKDTSFREIREFIRVDVQGGGEGVVRNYDKGLAYLKLENPSEFPRLMRQNGQKLRGNTIRIEGVSLEVWDNEYKGNKRAQEREREQRERERDRDHRGDRDRGQETRDRPRTSRFNGGANQSNCITIRGLPPAVTPKDVAARFFQDINVLDLVCLPDESPSTGRMTVTAWVQLDTVLSAQRAVDVVVKSSEGMSFVVESCEPDDFQSAKREAAHAAGSARMMGIVAPGSIAGGSILAEAKSLFDLDIGLDGDSSSVIIAGAPAGTSERTVQDFFSEIGLTPISVRNMYDQSGMPNGQIVCEFSDPSKARRATTKDGTIFGRVPVKVSLWPSSKGVNRNSNQSHLGLPSASANPFNPRGNRPSLLGPRPGAAMQSNSSTRFSNNHQSQNPFTQALQQSMPSPNPPSLIPTGVPHSRPRGPGGERPSRFSSSSNGDERFGGSSGGSRGDEMAPFENPGCVLALENVPFKASMDDILKFLEDWLKIQIPRNRIIRRFDDNQKPTGDARVAFDTPFEAKLAYQRLLGSTMWKRPISVSVLNHF